MWLVKFFKLS